MSRLVILQPHPMLVWPTASTIADVVSFAASLLHVRPLADDVILNGFHPVQRPEATFEDDHLLVAVQSLDAEDGVGVKFAGGA